MTFTDIVDAATSALTAVIPAGDLLSLAVAGAVLAIATRFGGRLIRSFWR